MSLPRPAMLCAVALSLAAVATFATPAQAESAAAVKVVSCTKLPTDRSVVFGATMKRVLGAARLQMRFAVQERVPGGAWQAVDAPGLSVWRTSKSGVASFTYKQRVKALAVGSSYRAAVDFRWRNGRGRTVASARRVSAICRQGEALPDLAVRRVAATAVAGRPKVGEYTVQVVNRGDAPAPASSVELLVDGSTKAQASVPRLAVDQLARIVFVAPRCKATMGGQADPNGFLREIREVNNALVVTCPFG